MIKGDPSVLLAVSGPKTEMVVADMVLEWRKAELTVRTTSREAWKSLQETTYSLVIVLSPLSDGQGIDLAQMAAQTCAGGIFVCRPQGYDAALQKLGETGVYVFSTDMGKRIFQQALRMMYAVNIRLAKDAPQTQMLQDRIKDIRVITRAKCLLIQYERMSEDQAHKTIEREAMNRQMSRREIAEEILVSYGA